MGHTPNIIAGSDYTSNKLKREAEEAGYWIKDMGSNHMYRTYQHIACGHIEEHKTGNVRKKAVACSHCSNRKIHQRGPARIERMKSDAEAKGLEFLGLSEKHKNYAHYKFPCGHIIHMNERIVRIGGEVHCRVCGVPKETPSYLYVTLLKKEDVPIAYMIGSSIHGGNKCWESVAKAVTATEIGRKEYANATEAKKAFTAWRKDNKQYQMAREDAEQITHRAVSQVYTLETPLPISTSEEDTE